MKIANNNFTTVYSYIASKLSGRTMLTLHNTGFPPQGRQFWYGRRPTPGQPESNRNDTTSQGHHVANRDCVKTIRNLMVREEWPTCDKHLAPLHAPRCQKTCLRAHPDLAVIWSERVATGNNPPMPPICTAANNFHGHQRVPWQINGVTVEILGSKDIWGSMESIWPGFVECSYALCFMPYCFYIAITKNDVSFFKLERNNDNAKLDVTREDIHLLPDLAKCHQHILPGTGIHGIPAIQVPGRTAEEQVAESMSLVLKKIVRCILEIRAVEDIMSSCIDDLSNIDARLNRPTHSNPPKLNGGFRPHFYLGTLGQGHYVPNLGPLPRGRCSNGAVGVKTTGPIACTAIRDFEDLEALKDLELDHNRHHWHHLFGTPY